MGKIARVSARQLAYDQMKAERNQYILLANTSNNNLKEELSAEDIGLFKHAIDINNTSF